MSCFSSVYFVLFDSIWCDFGESVSELTLEARDTLLTR